MTSPPITRTAFALIAGFGLWLSACSEGSAPERAANAATEAIEQAVPTPAGNAIAPVDDHAPNLVEPRAEPSAAVGPELTPDAAKGEKGARAVLLDWAHALEQGDWATARAQWGEGAAQAPDAAAAYAGVERLTVAVGDGAVEGGAGSLYYEVPVTITGARGGRPFRMEGPVVLRRVNDVDGASAAQLRWHIAQSGLKARAG